MKHQAPPVHRTRSGPPGRCAAACLLAALGVLSPSVAAADPAFVLSLQGCEGVDRAALLALLELELADVATSFRQGEPPLVELRCTDARVRMRIEDPVTAKAVERTVPRPEGTGAERALALSVAQLYVSSWLELLASPPELPARPPEERQAVERRARAVVEPALAEAPVSGPRATADLLLLGGAGLRDLESPLGTGLFGVAARFAPTGDWSVVLGVGLEHGVAARQRGEVELWLGGVELGAGASVLRAGPFALDVSARGGLLWARLVGRPRMGVAAGQLDDVGGRIVAGATGTLAFDALLLALSVDVGVDLRLPEGQVSDEAPVVASGPFAQARIGIGARL